MSISEVRKILPLKDGQKMKQVEVIISNDIQKRY